MRAILNLTSDWLLRKRTFVKNLSLYTKLMCKSKLLFPMITSHIQILMTLMHQFCSLSLKTAAVKVPNQELIPLMNPHSF